MLLSLIILCIPFSFPSLYLAYRQSGHLQDSDTFYAILEHIITAFKTCLSEGIEKEKVDFYIFLRLPLLLVGISGIWTYENVLLCLQARQKEISGKYFQSTPGTADALHRSDQPSNIKKSLVISTSPPP